MIQEVLMPKLGETVKEAKVESWRKAEGEPVKKGEVLLEITTDKATLEVESYFTGYLKKIVVPAGQTVPIGVIIGFIGDQDDVVTEAHLKKAIESLDAAQAAEPRPEEQARVASAGTIEIVKPAPAQAAAAVVPRPTGRIFASPRARKLAEDQQIPLAVLRGSGPGGRIVEADVQAYVEKLSHIKVNPTAKVIAYERGVDLLLVQGTGPSGRITVEDVEAALQAAAAPTAKKGRVPLTAMRAVIAKRMTESKQTIPHFYLSVEADMTAAVTFREQLNRSGNVRISFNDLILRACALAFDEVPEMNAQWAGDAVVLRDEINIGIAVSVEGGLMVPVVRGLRGKLLGQIARESALLIEKARNKRLTPDEYVGGCLTVSNLGMFGIESFLPIINPGEVGILGIGAIVPKPVIKDGGIHVRSMMSITLACDHRVVDGVIGAKFLTSVKAKLENPSVLGA